MSIVPLLLLKPHLGEAVDVISVFTGKHFYGRSQYNMAVIRYGVSAF